MADYTTKGSFNLGNQIALKNKNSNIDRDYGPYEEGKTLTDIATLLTDTIQIGKTIGVIESDKVVEYWWQAIGGGEYGFVKKVDTGTPVVNHQTEPIVTIQPNVMNVWGTITNLNITKGDDIDDIVNNYMIRFTVGEGTPDIRFDWGREEIQWYGGNEIEFVNGNTYEISIVNNIALWAEFEPKAE